MNAHTLYDIEVTRLQGESHPLRDYEGKVLLVVNTASKCGFTPHYRGLQSLHATYAERGLVVMGFPCNQFGKQEPGTADEIASFCANTYDVSFPMHAKVQVNGSDAHPLYVHLTESAPGLLGSRRIKWNFTKFLIDRRGNVVTRFSPHTKPKALQQAIESLL